MWKPSLVFAVVYGLHGFKAYRWRFRELSCLGVPVWNQLFCWCIVFFESVTSQRFSQVPLGTCGSHVKPCLQFPFQSNRGFGHVGEACFAFFASEPLVFTHGFEAFATCWAFRVLLQDFRGELDDVDFFIVKDSA